MENKRETGNEKGSKMGRCVCGGIGACAVHDGYIAGDVWSRCAGNYMYYVDIASAKYGIPEQTIAVKRCKLDGTGKITLAANIKIKSIEKFTKNSITYVDQNGKTKTKEY